MKTIEIEGKRYRIQNCGCGIFRIYKQLASGDYIHDGVVRAKTAKQALEKYIQSYVVVEEEEEYETERCKF